MYRLNWGSIDERGGMAYFLISVSNRINLDLCIKHALAGFTNSISGLWTFLEVQEGDFISFLYGAKVHSLYRVTEKEAIKNADVLPPWPPVTFRMSGRTYYFPFRLHLEPLREFVEPMVRREFAYVAENLLLRGGYRKTHFQADQTTLQEVSQMGNLHRGVIERLVVKDYQPFLPRLTWDRNLEAIPEVFRFNEFILQALIRQWLSSNTNLQNLLSLLGLIDLEAGDFEVLSEKALPEGHIDLLIKDSFPRGISRKIIVEVKTGNAKLGDLEQLQNYMDEMGEECLGGILIARNFPKKALQSIKKKKTVGYSFADIDQEDVYPFETLLQAFRLNPS